MPMTIYKLFASTDGDSGATLDIQLDGTIRAIHMSIRPDTCDLLDDGAEAELSFLSTSSLSANDTRGSLMIVQSKMGMLTTGAAQMCENAQISNLEIPVNAGERIHLHLNLLGGCVSCATHAFLFVEDRGVPRTAGRRR